MIQARQALGLVGLLTALAGIATDNSIVVWVAIGLLGVSVVLRAVATIVARRGDQGSPEAANPPG